MVNTFVTDMIPEAIKRLFNLRQSYKRVFTGRDGERVAEDLIRRYILADPVKDSADITMANVGMQRCAVEILKKVYGSDAELRKAIEKAEQTTNQTDE